MILQLLREGIRKTGEAAHRHPHGGLLTFYKASRNMQGVRIAAYRLHIAPDALCGPVTLLRLALLQPFDPLFCNHGQCNRQGTVCSKDEGLITLDAPGEKPCLKCLIV